MAVFVLQGHIINKRLFWSINGLKALVYDLSCLNCDFWFLRSLTRWWRYWGAGVQERARLNITISFIMF